VSLFFLFFGRILPVVRAIKHHYQIFIVISMGLVFIIIKTYEVVLASASDAPVFGTTSERGRVDDALQLDVMFKGGM